MNDVLTMKDVCALQGILEAAQRCCRVSWLSDGIVMHGTARSIGDQRGYFLHGGDVRDAYLRVTMLAGTDTYLPVRDLMRMVGEGEFAIAAAA